jgi:ABC-type transporter lipoprotein component MlaA
MQYTKNLFYILIETRASQLNANITTEGSKSSYIYIYKIYKKLKTTLKKRSKPTRLKILM